MAKGNIIKKYIKNTDWHIYFFFSAKGESKRKAKAKKDPNAPKKGMTGFLHFVQAKKDKFKEEN